MVVVIGFKSFVYIQLFLLVLKVSFIYSCFIGLKSVVYI